MYRNAVCLSLSAILVLSFASACKRSAKQPEASTENPVSKPVKPELGSFGVELDSMDPTVKPGDDFNLYANGTWLKNYTLKADEQRFGAFVKLVYRSEDRVKAIIDELSQGDAPKGSLEQKVRDYFNSYMDLESRRARGIGPLQPDLDRIAAISNIGQLVEEFGRARQQESKSPFGGFIGIDRKDPDRYILNIGHSGLGLPDRDYYLDDTERFKNIRAAYRANIERLLTLTGMEASAAAQSAESVLALETAMAQHHWPRAMLRDRDKTYNVMTVAQLSESHPGYDWRRHLVAAGVNAETVGTINVRTPSALEPIAKLVKDTPLATWRAYLTYHSVVNHAQLLSPDVDNAVFDFYGKTLGGQEKQRELWKRAVTLVGGGEGLGEALGKIYVDRHFSPDAKRKMDTLVENLRAALDERVASLDWMGDATRSKT
ncbi:MAG: M13 family metallopeptidase N-terminal domain-containing protein, partial [Myxococcota bacterium]